MKRCLACSAAALLIVVAAPAVADDIVCKKTLTNQTIDGNIVVPNGASCVLINNYVRGNIDLLDRAQLVVRNDTFVEGSVQADGAHRVRIRDSEVNGNIQLTGVDYSLGSLVVNTKVGGSIDWKDNDAEMLIRYNSVIGDIKVEENNRLVRIFDNKVGHDLRCRDNEPEPVGARNMVDGSKEGQCRKF